METKSTPIEKSSNLPTVKEICNNVRTLCLSWEKSNTNRFSSLSIEELQANKSLLSLINQTWRRICSHFTQNEVDLINLESISRNNLPAFILSQWHNNKVTVQKVIDVLRYACKDIEEEYLKSYYIQFPSSDSPSLKFETPSILFISEAPLGYREWESCKIFQQGSSKLLNPQELFPLKLFPTKFPVKCFVSVPELFNHSEPNIRTEFKRTLDIIHDGKTHALFFFKESIENPAEIPAKITNIDGSYILNHPQLLEAVQEVSEEIEPVGVFKCGIQKSQFFEERLLENMGVVFFRPDKLPKDAIFSSIHRFICKVTGTIEKTYWILEPFSETVARMLPLLVFGAESLSGAVLHFSHGSTKITLSGRKTMHSYFTEVIRESGLTIARSEYTTECQRHFDPGDTDLKVFIDKKVVDSVTTKQAEELVNLFTNLNIPKNEELLAHLKRKNLRSSLERRPVALLESPRNYRREKSLQEVIEQFNTKVKQIEKNEVHRPQPATVREKSSPLRSTVKVNIYSTHSGVRSRGASVSSPKRPSILPIKKEAMDDVDLTISVEKNRLKSLFDKVPTPSKSEPLRLGLLAETTGISKPENKLVRNSSHSSTDGKSSTKAQRYDPDPEVIIKRRKKYSKTVADDVIDDLMLAASSGSFKELRRIVHKYHADINSKNKHQRTMMHEACKGGHYEIVEYLYYTGADLNLPDEKGVTPLQEALKADHVLVAQFLRTRGAKEPPSTKEIGEKLLPEEGVLDEVLKMLENGADINYRSENNVTPLHVASFNGNIELAALLVSKGARTESSENPKKVEEPHQPKKPVPLPTIPVETKKSKGPAQRLNKFIESRRGKDPAKDLALGEKLGEGTIGSVWKAIYKRNGQTVALKKIRLATSDLENIMKEILVMKEFKSPYIIAYFGCYITPIEVWIVTEYSSGGSIKDIIKNTGRNLQEQQICTICKYALKGLFYLHSQGKIHKDIKAGNIMISLEGEIKLAYYGAAEVNRNIPYWLAPEVIQENEVTPKADVWALGVTCIEMAMGSAPMSNFPASRAQILIANGPPPELEETQNWGKEFIDFVRFCLQKNVEDRPLVDQLQQHEFIQKASTKSSLTTLVLESLNKQTGEESEKDYTSEKREDNESQTSLTSIDLDSDVDSWN